MLVFQAWVSPAVGVWVLVPLEGNEGTAILHVETGGADGAFAG